MTLTSLCKQITKFSLIFSLSYKTNSLIEFSIKTLLWFPRKSWMVFQKIPYWTTTKSLLSWFRTLKWTTFLLKVSGMHQRTTWHKLSRVWRTQTTVQWWFPSFKKWTQSTYVYRKSIRQESFQHIHLRSNLRLLIQQFQHKFLKQVRNVQLVLRWQISLRSWMFRSWSWCSFLTLEHE